MAIDDKDLKKVTKMLERGGTMLAKHCDCGAPLFKYQGKVVARSETGRKRNSRRSPPGSRCPSRQSRRWRPTR